MMLEMKLSINYLLSSIWDYNDAYILVRGDITAVQDNEN